VFLARDGEESPRGGMLDLIGGKT